MLRTIVLVLLVACNSSTSNIDASQGHNDAPKNVDAKVFMDAKTFMDAAAAVCTGKLYDACNPAASNCMTGTTCKTFNASGFSVCTQTCGTCPNQGATPVTCNGMGICKPSSPNAGCTAP